MVTFRLEELADAARQKRLYLEADCSACKGTGASRANQPGMDVKTVCQACHGKGKMMEPVRLVESGPVWTTRGPHA